MPLTPEQRKERVLAQRGLQAQIARELDVSENHVSLVVSGEREGSERLCRAVADALQMPVDDVFPPRIANAGVDEDVPHALRA